MQGKTINGFELKRLLGRGGMAEVWYAENEIGLKAAVKILSEELSLNAQMQERFLNEAKVMVKLDHPNIRKVYGYGSIDGRPAIIMEYLDGSDLKKRMKDGQHFTDEEMKRWWNQMVDALNYTHSQGIVHRDIKPSNIFIDQKGNAKLLDFGIAKVADTTTGTLTGSTLGTRIYMSPEQVKDPKRVGTASDVYSLAVSFVHLLTGKAPYDSTTSSDYDIQVSIVTKPVDLGKVPAEWRGFLAPYLAKEPSDRPALRTFVATTAAPPDEDDGTIDDEVPDSKPKVPSDPGRRPPLQGVAGGAKTPTGPSDGGVSTGSPTAKPKPILWIALAAIAAVAVLLVLLLKPKNEPTPTDPDTQAYEACQTVADYRAYMNDYGRNALHYADAKAFVEQYLADSIEQARNAQALADAEQKAKAQAEAEKKEEAAYKKCTTLAACNSYLKTYPQGRYVDEVKAKKAELEAQDEAERVEAEAYRKCTTIAACEKYLKDYPQGRYVAEVRAKKAELEAQDEAERVEAEAYRKCTTIAACEKYLKDYPQGRYVAEVRKKKAELEQAQQSQQSLSGSANGHEWVDLGLPSGTLWATCNIGAGRPEDYGNYYAWGETKTKSTYNWDTYKYANGDYDKLTKYCNKSDYGNNGFTDNLTTLQGSDDPATAWGSGWRTPSKAQWDELLANTTNTWTTQNGVKGRKFTSKKNGQSLFLPAAGDRWDSELDYAGSYGYYWSRSLLAGIQSSALHLYFSSGDCYMGYSSRIGGYTVRPVREN